MRFFILTLCCCFSFFLKGQYFQDAKRDLQWVFGINQVPNDFNQTFILNFQNNHFNIHIIHESETTIDIANSSLCNEYGDLSFYTNGLTIWNEEHQVVENGIDFNTSTAYDFSSGFGNPQGVLMLPLPEHKDTIYLFHLETHVFTEPIIDVWATELNFSLINAQANNGLGKVEIKDKPVLTDSLAIGHFTATRHANGRDWWIIMPKEHSNQYFILLFDPSGVRLNHTQTIDPLIPGGIGQAVFSPDGTKYVRVQDFNHNTPDTLVIYDFDRCSGLLSSPLRIIKEDGMSVHGVAISPNNRFLYQSSTLYVYQYDLWAENVEESRTLIAEYDGFTAPFGTNFWLSQLGPDGRIYINSTSSVTTIHVINYPDRLGLDSEVCQHCIDLPAYNFRSMPNFPNFRLGPLDGGPCDTLGIDNLPQAQFRWEAQSATVQFTDLSYAEPEQWLWDFGDGSGGSTEKHTNHTFPASGDYKVCLTVSNSNGTSTYCDSVSVVISGVEEVIEEKKNLVVFPNPAKNKINITILNKQYPDGVLHIYNSLGQKIQIVEATQPQFRLNTENWSSGAYFIVFYQKGRRIDSTRFVIRK